MQADPAESDLGNKQSKTRMFAPDFKAKGALTKDVAYESTGSGQPSEATKGLMPPVPEFKNYMRADGRYVQNGFDIEAIAKINEEDGRKRKAFDYGKQPHVPSFAERLEQTNPSVGKQV